MFEGDGIFMVARAARFFLAVAALLSAAGGAIHAAAFAKARTALTASNLPHFYLGSSKALWLSDSATLLVVAMILGVVGARPLVSVRTLMMLVALIPASTAVLLYLFLGSFFAAHLLLLIAALSFCASFGFSPGVPTHRTPR